MKTALLMLAMTGCSPMLNTPNPGPDLTPYDAGACCAPVCWRLFDTLPDGGLLGYATGAARSSYTAQSR